MEGGVFVLRGLMAIDGNRRGRVAGIAGRSVTSEGRRLDSGEGEDASKEFLVKIDGALEIVSCAAQVHGGEEHALGRKTRIEIANALQALHEETCADQ